MEKVCCTVGYTTHAQTTAFLVHFLLGNATLSLQLPKASLMDSKGPSQKPLTLLEVRVGSTTYH
jgi:hypothetical protein